MKRNVKNFVGKRAEERSGVRDMTYLVIRLLKFAKNTDIFDVCSSYSLECGNFVLCGHKN